MVAYQRKYNTLLIVLQMMALERRDSTGDQKTHSKCRYQGAGETDEVYPQSKSQAVVQLSSSLDHALPLVQRVCIFDTRKCHHPINRRIGLRAQMGAGWSRMNDLIIIQTSQAGHLCHLYPPHSS